MEQEEKELQWTHRHLLDISGEKIGTIEDIRYDDTDIGPKWLLVKGGFFGSHKVFVPAREVRSSRGELAVPFTKERVMHAPRVSRVDYLSGDDERVLGSYYGLEQ
jgi:hypothetical protein